MSNVIEVKNLTKDYGRGKGIFDVNITVDQGEVYGFLGPNGAGKTTTIRNLMGFIRPNKGQCNILGMDCYKEAAEIQKKLGYLAGEISFLDDFSGMQMMDFMASMKGIKDKKRINELIERFELDPKGRIRKMSKGMKQKIGIICAFMDDPQVILLDEPTSGLDPLMQNRFVDLVMEEKKKGKTIFMSSHIFEEIEKTCDRTAIIKEGKIVSVENMNSLVKKKKKFYNVTFEDTKELKEFLNENVEIMEQKQNVVTAVVKGDINPFLRILSKYNIKDLDIRTQTLEEIFLHYYGGEK